MTKLDARIEVFVEEYIIDFNGVRAARKAGYEGDEKTLAVQANRLLRNAKVQLQLQKAIRARVDRTRIKADKVLHEIHRIAMLDVSDFAEWDGERLRLKPSKDLKRGKTRVISEIAEGKYGPKLKFWDKLEALRLLVEHLGISKPKEEDETDSNKDNVEVHVYLPDNQRANIPEAADEDKSADESKDN